MLEETKELVLAVRAALDNPSWLAEWPEIGRMRDAVEVFSGPCTECEPPYGDGKGHLDDGEQGVLIPCANLHCHEGVDPTAKIHRVWRAFYQGIDQLNQVVGRLPKASTSAPS